MTDLSSLSSEGEGSPSHRRYSSTSFILTKQKQGASNSKQTQAPPSSFSHKTHLGVEKKDRLQPHHSISGSGENQNRLSSLNLGGRGKSSSRNIKHQTKEPNLQVSNLNRSNGSSGQDELGLVTGSDTGAAGHLFTEEEVKCLQQRIADMQIDIDQLLQYTQASIIFMCNTHTTCCHWSCD